MDRKMYICVSRTQRFSSQSPVILRFLRILRVYRILKRKDVLVMSDRMEKINTSFQNVVQAVNKISVV